jgi:hypothetical protein
VYSLTGAPVYQGTASGSEERISLPARGIYILQAGGSVLKVVVR